MIIIAKAFLQTHKMKFKHLCAKLSSSSSFFFLYMRRAIYFICVIPDHYFRFLCAFFCTYIHACIGTVLYTYFRCFICGSMWLFVFFPVFFFFIFIRCLVIKLLCTRICAAFSIRQTWIPKCVKCSSDKRTESNYIII